MTETGAASQKHLVRGIGSMGLAIIVINSMIGAGIFALPAAVSARAGVLSPWLFLAVGVLDRELLALGEPEKRKPARRRDREEHPDGRGHPVV